MKKYLSLVLFALAALLCSCTKTLPNVFGSIPSIYEDKIFEVAKKAHDLNKAKGMGAGTEIIKSEAPLAYDAANEESLPIADDMIGAAVNMDVEPGLEYELTSKAKITAVSLPVFDLVNSRPLSITVDFDIKGSVDEARLYYMLCGEQDTIHCGFIDVPPVMDGELHVSAEIEAPNIPAEYQEKVTVIHLVSEGTYGYTKSFVDEDQKLWRQEYNKRLNDGKMSDMPIR